MADYIISGIVDLIYIVMLLAGICCLAFGLFSLFVPKYDSNVRFFLFAAGILLLLAVIYLNSPGKG